MSGAVSLTVTGPTLTLRYAEPDDAERLFELASDPDVTRWFSWGPYTGVDQPRTYIESLERKREDGVRLDFVIDHREAGVIGVTGLSEFSPRNARATIGTWLGCGWWGSGANAESKRLMAGVAFAHLGLRRLTAWTNVRNGRAQRALERAGFRREGVLRGWEDLDGQRQDVVVFGLLREDWLRSSEAGVPQVAGRAPEAFAPWDG
jgi:ribosomal-protein-alanine N-acetyltransferase